MKILRYTIKLLIFCLFLAAIDYNLPSIHVVRVVGTEVVRMDVGQRAFFWSSGDSGIVRGSNRDIRFINTVNTRERPVVYRNEDTAIGWPPYFKFDSGNLQARAQNMVGEWAAVRHYGWRITALSIYPNALSIKALESPADRPRNWIRIIGFIICGLAALAVWRLGYLVNLWVREKVQILMHRIGLKGR
ncbi:MAG: DUF1523 family protein [Rhodobacteraceae bacterium]|nr:DUF1523 family protein [Paracoccaceae bacterium]